VLEHGGRAPNLLFEDADLDDATRGAVWGVFQDAGQVCSAATRLEVQSSVADQVVERLIGLTDRIRVGDPLDLASHIGPVASQTHHRRVLDYLDSARSDGARLSVGGNAVGSSARSPRGSYVAPTIVTKLDPGARVAGEEIFGSVLSVLEFDTEEDALAHLQ